MTLQWCGCGGRRAEVLNSVLRGEIQKNAMNLSEKKTMSLTVYEKGKRVQPLFLEIALVKRSKLLSPLDTESQSG